MTSDLFTTLSRGYGGMAGPATGVVTVTPSDDEDIATGQCARALYIETAGDVTATGFDGVDFTIAVPDNFILPVAVTRVKSTGTDATGIFAFM